jgi:nicotinamide-nucleotide amidase
MSDEELLRLATRLGAVLKARGWRLATAESCTGGWVGAAITSVAGSSAWYERGFITYANEAKRDMLGVGARTLADAGAVSEACVREMAAGAVAHSRADTALAVSGIAGPDGGTPDKPVGLVWFAWALPGGEIRAERGLFQGGRQEVRRQAVGHVLRRLTGFLETLPRG